ncbi:GNAT family N-acetyltransferase [Photobacterium sp. GB-27]|uniref:GNAT family N-acetyltransferase n=1 Tax=Photobacterium sp. GB-27 TaxID=2022109 RepID=UPI000D1667B4|nr:GNAT family N-acetyltransferase [Photobacterium sp. GB-27]PSV34034.1 GNAT family N-acetyltransferase [Photobacterium sp. GB-27]
MENIIIRHSEDKDIMGVKAIYESEIAYGGTLQLPFPSLDRWTSRLSNLPQGCYSLVAEYEGEIVGQLGLSVCDNPRRRHVASFGMAVKETFQGRGVGGQLLQSALMLADKWLNVQRIELEVYTDNIAAMKLYQKHGFEIEGEAKNFAFRNGEYANVYHMARLRTYTV